MRRQSLRVRKCESVFGDTQLVTPLWKMTRRPFFLLLSSFAFLACGNLLAQYTFAGNALDSSGNGYHGVNSLATLTNDRFGNVNSAYYFNGYSSKVTTFSFNFLATHAFTVTCWIKLSQTGSWQTIFGNCIDEDSNFECAGGNYDSLSLRVSDSGRLFAEMDWSTGGIEVTGSIPLALETDYFVGMTISRPSLSNPQISLFLNGVKDTQTSLRTKGDVFADSYSNMYLTIGASGIGENAVGGFQQYFNGIIDDVLFDDAYFDTLTLSPTASPTVISHWTRSPTRRGAFECCCTCAECGHFCRERKYKKLWYCEICSTTPEE
jgi:hypothetical protein